MTGCVCTLHRNVLDSKTENDGPDHSKSHFHIAINNLCRDREKISFQWKHIQHKYKHIHSSRSSLQYYTCFTLYTFSTNGHQFDSFTADEVQSLVDIGDFVKTHLSFVRLGQSLTCQPKTQSDSADQFLTLEANFEVNVRSRLEHSCILHWL